MRHNSVPSYLWACARLMRWHQPIGFYLLLAPTLWALILAGDGAPRPALLLIFTLGAFVMRSAGCVINDFWDIKLDGKVRRTKKRPLASGALRRADAIGLFILLLALALGLLFLLNSLAKQLALFAVMGTMLYPLCKRFFLLPQLILGMVFGLGVPMAYAAQADALPLAAWALYALNLIWIIAYDTQYALCDKEDDRLMGMHSSALTFGRAAPAIIAALQAILVCGLIVFGAWQGLGPLYYGAPILGAVLFMRHWRQTNGYQDAAACFNSFRANHYFGWITLFGFWVALI